MNYDDMVKGLVSKIVIARIVARQPKKLASICLHSWDLK